MVTGVRVAIKTFGCRLNQAETARFAVDFAAAGWAVVPFGAAAEVVVIHGCAVTRTAELKCLQLARSVKRAARDAKAVEPFVVLVGCVVEADAARREWVGVDLLLARGDKERVVEIVCARLGQALSTRSGPFDRSGQGEQSRGPRRKRALLKVQDGCNFFCSYCIVPHTRGAPVSRPWQEVLDEARSLAQEGFAELVIAGCNVACYRDGARGLAELVAAIAAIGEVQRIRLSSIEPSTSEREIIDLMAACRKLCRYLHLPLQSGDAETLRRMGRRYTPEEYAETVRTAVRRMPDLAVGTDVIVGFPGETEAAFERTRQFVSALPFSNLHVFPYSERPGTPAAACAGAVPRAIRRARARALVRLHAAKRLAFAGQFVGRTVEVLIESLDPDGCGRGWSGQYLGCRVNGVQRASIGRLITFTPTCAVDGVLRG